MRADSFNSRRLTACGSALLCIALLLPACAAHPQSSRMTLGDLDATTAAMAASLAQSEFLRDRTPTSPPVVIVINKVQNLTHDVIPAGEQWMFVKKVIGSMDVQTLSQQKNIRIVATPEQMGGPSATALQPTHVMSATFLSSPRGGRSKGDVTDVRSDFYYLEYTVTNLTTRQIAWQETFEFQRQAKGKLID